MLMSYLNRQRTKESYFDKLSVKSKGTIRNTKFALEKFDRFITSKFVDRSLDDIIQELLILKPDDQERSIYDLLQDFVNFMNSEGRNHSTIRGYFSIIKKYMVYRGFKIHNEDVKQNIELPRIVEDEKYGLTKKDIMKILDNSNPKRKALYLTLLSSGMRISEACALRKHNFDQTLGRIVVRIPAKFTKTKKARITFVSKEAEEYLKPPLTELGDDELVFGVNEDNHASALVELNHFNRLRKRAKFSEDRYESGVHKITIHSFRAYFITVCNRIDFGLSHALVGHSAYLKQYDRLSLEEKLKIYLKCEPYLNIYSNQEIIDDKDKRITELEVKLERLAKLIERANENV